MYQRWHDLLFAHWALPAEQVRPLVPRELDLDTFDGKAWIGVIQNMDVIDINAAISRTALRSDGDHIS